MANKRVLVVGAGGFTGGFIVAEGLRRGYEVWAGVRESTSRKFLTAPAIKFLVLDFDEPDTLASTMRDALPSGERWDYIVYNLGATKALHFMDFSRINHDYLNSFLNALKVADMVPDKLLYMSSLSVMGKGDERGYTPFREDMIPNPDTRYGTSKLKAETCLESSGVPYIIFRCTGIYGPHERDYFLMFKSIAQGVDFSVGFRKQMLTFIYVEDLVTAIYDALEQAPIGHKYIISEDHAYTQKEFRTLVAEKLGKKFVLPIVAPIWVLKCVCAVSGFIGRIKGKPMTLNPDKYKIMKQRNWRADISAAKRDFGFRPSTDLKAGVARSIDWYRQAGWLKA
ncbi:MAG: NAD(P)-dependent oxidoreductase [Muribaculaceae bacterium]|nr:NAD(P)-dependent oxidoreductase [Muribaculaceae bacterium]